MKVLPSTVEALLFGDDEDPDQGHGEGEEEEGEDDDPMELEANSMNFMQIMLIFLFQIILVICIFSFFLQILQVWLIGAFRCFQGEKVTCSKKEDQEETKENTEVMVSMCKYNQIIANSIKFY